VGSGFGGGEEAAKFLGEKGEGRFLPDGKQRKEKFSKTECTNFLRREEKGKKEAVNYIGVLKRKKEKALPRRGGSKTETASDKKRET